jgi:hypothetical protein
MELNSKNVHETLLECLFDEGEPTDGYKVGEGITKKVGFHPLRLEANRSKVEELLAQLPDDFKAEGGGGSSFLNACLTKDGQQWGEHSNIEELLLLGTALGSVSYPMPRELWGALPGGMPYFAIK